MLKKYFNLSNFFCLMVVLSLGLTFSQLSWRTGLDKHFIKTNSLELSDLQYFDSSVEAFIKGNIVDFIDSYRMAETKNPDFKKKLSQYYRDSLDRDPHNAHYQVGLLSSFLMQNDFRGFKNYWNMTNELGQSGNYLRCLYYGLQNQFDQAKKELNSIKQKDSIYRSLEILINAGQNHIFKALGLLFVFGVMNPKIWLILGGYSFVYSVFIVLALALYWFFNRQKYNAVYLQYGLWVLLLLLGALYFFNHLGSTQFIFGDEHRIAESADLSNFWQNLSWMQNHRTPMQYFFVNLIMYFTPEPFITRLISISIHLVNAYLVYSLLLKFKFIKPMASLMAVTFVFW